MELTEEWKSLFPISAVFSPPLLLPPLSSSSSSSSSLGPLFFNPNPKTLTQLFKSPSLSPPLLSPHPHLTLSRFLCTSSSPDSPILLSTSSSIASPLLPNPTPTPTPTPTPLSFNRLQFLHCPYTNLSIVFFSTGFNHDQIGYLLLSVNNSNLAVQVDDDGCVFTSKNRLNHRIMRILVSPVDDFLASNPSSCVMVTIGYVMAVTMYSVHWFAVKIDAISGCENPPVLCYMGYKLFKTCSVVGACWSHHLPAECLVLLESGQLFLFDMESNTSNSMFSKGTRLRVKWDDYVNLKNCNWLSCDFSWHPRIVIIACSDAVYLVDLRFDECNITCLAKIEMLRLYCLMENEQFLAFSRAGSDGFQFVVASNSLLVLCDVRRPMFPVLQWAHCLLNPCYIDVFRLSDLRSHARDETYERVTESGFCIIVGSFLNSEFSLFCYGPLFPGRNGFVALEISKNSKPLFAWELPSDLLLSGCECRCGNCLIKEEFFKDALPEWVDWQQKKELVLGFGILNNKLSSLLYEPDEFGGFTLLRLMSSGKLESQRYYASWELVKKSEVAHRESLNCEDNLLYSVVDEDYKFPKRFRYLKFDYLYGYLNGNLTEVLDFKMKKPCNGHGEKESFFLDFHEVLCEKLHACGFGRFRTAPVISVVFNDINLPTSIHEVALRRIWADLPMEILQLAFSSYAEFLEVLLNQNKVSLEFLVVPDVPQLPPFFLRKPSFRSSKWSHRVQRSDALVGPVLPLPFLLTLHEFCNGCLNSQEVGGFSSEVEINLRCNEVMEVAKEMAVLDFGVEFGDVHTVSLEADNENLWVNSQKSKPFFLYHPSTIEDSALGYRPDKYKDDNFMTLISKVLDKEPAVNKNVDAVGLEAFDDLCPFKLKFEGPIMDFESQDKKTYNILKTQFSRWQEGFDQYQSICIPGSSRAVHFT
ncbi:hypothetical protein CFOL_v3_20898 [Cephalotus follicularis]|uniref:Uncharacterized protein n=1 Tax=Cephalotus follicularis TaxID=3775 RepID=A0A1Q3CB20_CEPFO|nr:hypothetical protein CFOL_v3_20898 [Cephalotus follicularis]